MRRVSWPLTGVTAGGVMVLAAAMLWPVGGDHRRTPADIEHTVVYRVSGDGPAKVDWISDLDHGARTAVSAVEVPWTSDPLVTTRSGFETHAEATGEGGGTVRCSITIDGQLVAEATGTDGERATCAYTFTAP